MYDEKRKAIMLQEAKHLQGISQFAMFIRDNARNSDECYEIFDALTQQLRDEIYQTFWCLSEHPEPARAALRQIGERYCVEALMNY